MADPLSIATGILALVGAAYQSSQLLYNTVSSFQSRDKTVRQLKEELEGLDAVLVALKNTMTTTNVDFSMLEIPIRRCGKACADFEATIIKCTARSEGPRTSFRDWAKLKYMGDDITAFKDMVAGYKSTIAIALADANVRTSAVTAQVLEEFKDMIANTTSDLGQHLEAIDLKLQAFSSQGPRVLTDEDAKERQRIQEERDSAQQCISICTQVSEHIDQVLPNTFKNVSTRSGTYHGNVNAHTNLTSVQKVTAQSLTEIQEMMSSRTTWLRKQLQEIDVRLRSLQLPSQQFLDANEPEVDQENIQEELDSIKQCLAICQKASKRANQERINVFEDVSVSEDGQQVIVSTIGDLISAKRITAGARSMQLMGQMSDSSLQQLAEKPRKD